MAEVCNFERLESISMGDEEFAGELVRVFLDDASGQIVRLREAIEGADSHAAGLIAHRIKGAAGNVGAETLAEACLSLERAALDLASPDLTPGFGQVCRELERARAAFLSKPYVR